MAIDWLQLATLILAGIGAVWSVMVAVRYSKDKAAWTSHREKVGQDLAEMQEAATSMLEVVEQVLTIFQQQNPQSLPDALEKVDHLIAEVQDMPAQLQRKLAGTLGAHKKHTNERESAVYELLDAELDNELITRLGAEGAGPLQQKLAEVLIQHPDAGPWVRQWMIDRGVQQMAQQGAVQSQQIPTHILSR